MKASQAYKTQRLNAIDAIQNVDGTTTIRIFKHGWKRAYTFKASNLYGKNEKILEDEEIEE